MPDSYTDGIGVWRCLTCLRVQPCGCSHSTKGPRTMLIFDADDPLVLDGTYDREGYKPGERARIEKARVAQAKGQKPMSKKSNGGVPRGRKSPKPIRSSPRRKQSRQQVDRVLAGATRKRPTQPRARPLPGMENARISPLDDICTSIAETREQMNSLRQEETGLETTALKLMRKHQKTAWRHSGVELIRVPGEEKLRVRTARERTATAESEEAETDVIEEVADAGEPEDAFDDAGDAAEV